LKRVAFTETKLKDVYNLAFGRVDQNNEIDDATITNNGDRNKILATVASIIKIFTNRYPERWIHFEGSTKSRTRLYRMAIGLNFEELSKDFFIFGFLNEEPIPFAKNMNASSFLIKRKDNFA